MEKTINRKQPKTKQIKTAVKRKSTAPLKPFGTLEQKPERTNTNITEIYIFSCYNDLCVGSYVYIICTENETIIHTHNEMFTTKIELEIKAIIQALNRLKPSNDYIIIYVNSLYIIRYIATDTLQKWVKSKFKRDYKPSMPNKALLYKLHTLLMLFKINWQYITKESKIPYLAQYYKLAFDLAKIALYQKKIISAIYPPKVVPPISDFTNISPNSICDIVLSKWERTPNKKIVINKLNQE